ncbi:MAG: proline iminopeptidase [Gammaproteobacteria bacterium]|nr:proline iminopeptidase [Gammaproteobacteria bacterium]
MLFLHGGPGAGCSPEHRRFFDPKYYRIILFDQRGAGRSTPHGEVTNNTTAHLVSDIEALRDLLKIPVWHVFGGSWGSTLALAYAQAHPQPCLSLTLRGIFLLRASEVDWFVDGLRHFAPLAWEQFVGFLPESLRGDICNGYWTQLNHALPEIRLAAANSWATYEARSVMLRTNAAVPAPAVSGGVASAGGVLGAAATNSAGVSPPALAASASQSAVGLARLEVHYMRANQFVPDDALLRGVDRIRHIPCAIVQGKYDLLCPPITAVALHSAWPESTLQIIEDAGHSAFEPGIRAALVAIMDARRTTPR